MDDWDWEKERGLSSDDKLLHVYMCVYVCLSKYLTSPSDIFLDEITATTYPKHKKQEQKKW